MARKLARILLAMLVGVFLGGIMACGDSGPAQQAQEEMTEADEMGAMDEADEMGTRDEADEADEEETQ